MVVPEFSAYDIDNLKRSVAMLNEGQPAMSKETATRVLADLEGYQRGLQHIIEECRALLAAE